MSVTAGLAVLADSAAFAAGPVLIKAGEHHNLGPNRQFPLSSASWNVANELDTGLRLLMKPVRSNLARSLLARGYSTGGLRWKIIRDLRIRG